MLNQPVPAAIDLLVLGTLEEGCDSVTAISQQVGQPEGSVSEAVSRLAQRGLVETVGGSVVLTADGRRAAAHVRVFSPRLTGATTPTFGLGDVSRFMGMLWSAGPGQRPAPTRRGNRDTLLASYADRDTAVQLLSDAFAQGRLSSSELEDRTSKALTARTYGDLEATLAGLGGLPSPPRTHPVRRAVFWVAAVLATPWMLFGFLLLVLGADWGDRLGGMFFLALPLAGLVPLGRWALRRT